jgi:hypothetical protein
MTGRSRLPGGEPREASQRASSLVTRAWHLLMAMGCATSLTSCGHAVPERVQILADTIPPGAACTVSQGEQLIGHVASTPGIVLVANADADYLLNCQRRGFPKRERGCSCPSRNKGAFRALWGYIAPSLLRWSDHAFALAGHPTPVLTSG